jgi:hypothetical protein
VEKICHDPILLAVAEKEMKVGSGVHSDPSLLGEMLWRKSMRNSDEMSIADL